MRAIFLYFVMAFWMPTSFAYPDQTEIDEDNSYYHPIYTTYNESCDLGVTFRGDLWGYVTYRNSVILSFDGTGEGFVATDFTGKIDLNYTDLVEFDDVLALIDRVLEEFSFPSYDQIDLIKCM